MSNTHNGIFLADENGNLKEYGNTGGGTSGGGGSAHVITDGTTEFTQRSKLKFTGSAVNVTDDSEDDATNVQVTKGGSSSSTKTLAVANWTAGTTTSGHAFYYNLNSFYPAASYDTVISPSPTNTAAALSQWESCGMIGDDSNNYVRAKKKPTVDIIVNVVAISKA